MAWRYRGTVVAAVAALTLAGCGPGQVDAPAGPSAASTSAPGAPPSPTPVAQYCGDAVPRSLKQRQLTTTDGAALNTAWLGSGKTVAVLLHQTDGDGMCGFLFYADFLARKGIRVALVDLCGYGQSHCDGRPLDADPAAQIKLVTDAARAEGANRVVLVGASMGGSVAVTAAQAARPDAIVDLSGPADFDRFSISEDAKHITMPALFAFAHLDEPDLVAVRQQLPAMPTTRKVFLTYNTGHGYDLLRDLGSGDPTPLADRVARWVSVP